MKLARCMLLLALTACTGPSGSTFDQSKQYGLVVYRPGSYIGTVHRAYVKVNGEKLCNLGNGEFANLPVSGTVALTASKYQLPGQSTITVQSPTYVKIEQRNPLAGLSQNESAEDAANGPFIFTVVPEAVARKELKGSEHVCVTKEKL